MIFIPFVKAPQAALVKVQVAAVAATKSLFFFLLFFLLIELHAGAETTIEFLNNLLFQEGRGGKQVIDNSGNQALRLYEPILFLDTWISETTHFHLETVYDAFSSASAQVFDSISGASGAATTLDAVTAASGSSGDDDGESEEGAGVPWESRWGLDANFSHKADTWTFTPLIGYSNEMDYVSLHGGFNIQKSLAEDNFTLALGAYYYQDRAYVFDLAAGRFAGWTPKITRSYNASLSQLLGPADLILVGASYTRQDGFLSSNTNTVMAANERVQEILPGQRDKWTGTARYVHGFNGWLALHFDYRYYTDSWGILAHTLEPSLAFEPEDESSLLRLAYRFHSQQGTRYYKETFPVRQVFMTSDSDLEAFGAREVRLQYTRRLELPGSLQLFSVSGALVYYFRDNRMDIFACQFGVGEEF